MVGIPGFDETTGGSRTDLGAVRTFTTTGNVPDPATYELWAETLTQGSNTNQFGEKTLYDAASNTLFVAAPNTNTVHVYANEGLYWRPVDMLTGGAGFGTDMALSGNRMVIGAPGANKAYIYERNGGVWTQVDTDGYSYNGVTPLSGTGGFGTSVAIIGDGVVNRIVVGEPTANVGYSTLGRSGAVDLSTPGDAVVYKLTSGRWQLERRLMPSDGSLPTSGLSRPTTSIRGSGTVYVCTDSYTRGTQYVLTGGMITARRLRRKSFVCQSRSEHPREIQ